MLGIDWEKEEGGSKCLPLLIYLKTALLSYNSQKIQA